MEKPTDKPYHHGDLRASLLSAAGELLEKHGAEAVSLRAAARAVGVSQTAPYNHFDSKEALLVALAGEGFTALRQSQNRALAASAAGLNALEALGLDYVMFAVRQPQRYRLMFGVGLKDPRALASVADAKRASFEPLRTTLHAMTANPDPVTLDSVAVAAWALVHGLASLYIDGSLADPQFETQPRASRVHAAIAAFAKSVALP